MPATLTLGCNSYTLNPSDSPVQATYSGADWYITTKDCNPIEHTSVLASEAPDQNLIFEVDVIGLSANVSTGANGDGQDRLLFKGNVTRSTVVTGNPISQAGDSVSFERSVTLSTITTSVKNDTVLFASSSTAGTTVNLGAGIDSISFTSINKVEARTVINLGRADRSIDTVSVAAKSTFQGAGVVINNFEVGRDVLLAPNTVIRNQSEANAYFGSGSVTLNS
jgi:hypothetical protein